MNLTNPTNHRNLRTLIFRRRSVSRVLYLCGHLSRTAIARRLQRATRRVGGPRQPLLSALASDGVYQADVSPRRRCALTAPFHLHRIQGKRAEGKGKSNLRHFSLFPFASSLKMRLCFFCGTFRRVTPPGRYPASRPVKPGLSSMAANCHSDHLTFCALILPRPLRFVKSINCVESTLPQTAQAGLSETGVT